MATIQKGGQVWYWPTPNSPAPLNATLGESLPAVIYRVAGNTGRSAFISSGAVTLDLNIAGLKTILRGVVLVIGTPSAEQLALPLGFCTTRPYIPPPKPKTFEEALAQVRLGKTVYRVGTRLSPEDLIATDWL